MPGLDCQRVRSPLSDYLDGELGPDVCAELESHMAECPVCSNELRAFRDLLRMAQDEAIFPLLRGFSKRLYSKLEPLREVGRFLLSGGEEPKHIQ